MVATSVDRQEQHQARRALPALTWGIAVILGAAFMRFGHPERALPLLAEMGKHESVHIVAHAVLYGTLALLSRGLSRRPWFPIAVVLVIGFLQEAAQTLWGKGMGAAEAFDLGVDVAAAAIFLGIARFRERASTSPGSPSRTSRRRSAR